MTNNGQYELTKVLGLSMIGVLKCYTDMNQYGGG
jgi:hypothetical protein